MRTTILWLHALGGVAWIGAAAVFVIASGAIGLEDEEGLAMVRRVAPVINRIGLGAMLFIVVSGIVNIYIAGLMRRLRVLQHFHRIAVREDRHPARDVWRADDVMARGANADVIGASKIASRGAATDNVRTSR